MLATVTLMILTLTLIMIIMIMILFTLIIKIMIILMIKRRRRRMIRMIKIITWTIIILNTYDIHKISNNTTNDTIITNKQQMIKTILIPITITQNPIIVIW